MTTETQAPAPAPVAAPAQGAPVTPPTTAPAPQQQAAAPAQAPVAPLADLGLTDPETNAPAADKALGAVTYEKTGDVGLDMALGFVGKLGFGPDHPAMKAATNGDFNPLKIALAAKGDAAKGWEQYVDLAAASHGTRTQAADAQRAKDQAVIYEAVGGEANWAAIRTWAKANAEPAELTSINAALRGGGLVAKITAQWLASKHGGASGTVQEPQAVTKPGTAGKADSVGPLTAKAYSDEVQALRKTAGYNLDNHPAYKALQSRRQAGLRSGI